MSQDNKVGSFPEILSHIIGVEMIVLLKPNSMNKQFTRSSIAVGQYTVNHDLLAKFTYTTSNFQQSNSEVTFSSIVIKFVHLDFIIHTILLDSGTNEKN